MLQKKDVLQLIELCKSGDRKAQQKIFDLKKDELFAICKRYSKNQSEAEDMLIEGFTKIFKHIDTYAYGDFDSWTKRIIINTCINIYNRESKRRENEIVLEEIYEEIEISSDVEYSYEDLSHCLEQLNDKHRTIFNLFAIDGYKSKEIAEILNISNDSVRTTLHRSRLKLQQLLSDIDKNRRAK